MVISIHQPSYFPWLGLIDKINKSQIFILMDEVQLADRAYQHRNILIDRNGQKTYISIPIEKRNYRQKRIRDLAIANEKWQVRHEKFIFFNYRHSKFFGEVFDKINPFFKKKYNFLIDALLDSMKLTMDLFSVKTKFVIQSELDYSRKERKSDLILELVKRVQGDIYLSGVGARTYLKLENFGHGNIKVVFNEFEHPTYVQCNSIEFIPGLACLDSLFSIGIENSRKLIRQ